MKKLISGLAMSLLVILFIAALCTKETEGSRRYGSSNQPGVTVSFERSTQAEDIISGYMKNIKTADKISADNKNVDSISSQNGSDNVKGEVSKGYTDTYKKINKNKKIQPKVSNEKAPGVAESSSKKAEPSKNKQEKNIKGKSSKSNKPMVALTFDDGPHPQYTLEILNALKKCNGHATFFVVGNRAEKYKSVIEKINENGNQIGNHSYDHKQLTKLSKSDMANELNKTSDIINSIIHLKPHIVRPTYGSVNSGVKSTSGAPLILWSIDTLDWKTKNKNMIVDKVVGKVKDGDIILMHDLYKTSAQAAEVIIHGLSSKGYKLVTIDEMFAARGIKLTKGMVYYKAGKRK